MWSIHTERKTVKKTFSKINLIKKFKNKKPGISSIEMLLRR